MPRTDEASAPRGGGRHRPWAAVLVLALSFSIPNVASAAASPWWGLGQSVRPAQPGGGFDAELVLSAVNLGDGDAGGGAGPVTITDLLPAGLTPVSASALAGQSSTTPMQSSCSLQPDRVDCELEGSLVPYDRIEVRIAVDVGTDFQPGDPNRFLVSGGGAPAESFERTVDTGGPPSFGFEEFELRPEAGDGGLETQAGAHPFQVTTAFAFQQNAEALPTAMPKDLRLDLPPGLIANATTVPACGILDLREQGCSPESAIGVATFSVNDPSALGLTSLVSPVFNLSPASGQPARFGFVAKEGAVFLNASLREDDRFAARLAIANITQLVGVLGGTVTLWGVPGDPRHDPARGEDCLRAARGDPERTCHPLQDPDPRAFLTLPTSCTATSLASGIEVSSWADRSTFRSASRPFPTLVGCGRLPYSPSLDVRPTATAPDSPSGLELELDAPLAGFTSPSGFSESMTGAAGLGLPPGMAVNPAAAAGLEVCTAGELAAERPAPDPGTGCPEAAKIGSATAISPLFARPLDGAVYAAAPDENPFGGLLALYLVLRDADRGLLFSLPIRIDADARSGRLGARLDGIPELPLSRLTLRFEAGPRAVLTTPESCGRHAIAYELAPSSGATPLAGADSFDVEGGCPFAFAPSLKAGTAANAAGRSAPFVFEIANSTAPNLAGVGLELPPGLVATLGASRVCPEPAVLTAACPTSSRLGYARIAVGSGPNPLWVPAVGAPGSDVYLAGPFRSAPYSLLIAVSAAAGPYDLGRVVLRAPVRVDPRTARVSVELSGLPQILSGVPLGYRALRLVLDRPGLRNPTSCEPMRIEAVATGAGGESAALSERFQAAACGALAFKPGVRIGFSGGLGRGAHPRVTASLKARDGDANVSRASLALPATVLLDPSRLRALCPRATAPESCPPASRLGAARLVSPLFDRPLRGSVYLRQPTRRLPGLVADLRSGDLRILLHGRTSGFRGRLRVDFPSLPDVPLTSARFVFAGGKRGIFVNSTSLCPGRPRAWTALEAHNGKRRQMRPAVRLRGRC